MILEQAAGAGPFFLLYRPMELMHPQRRRLCFLLAGTFLLLVSAGWLCPASAGRAEAGTSCADIRSAMVKIRAMQTPPYYDTPWDKYNPCRVHGSGCVIQGGRILTNAHVVSDQSFLQVWRHGQTRKYNAEVRFVSHEADLALLRVPASEFYRGAVPLPLGRLPEIQQEVSVMGFPAGGETLSITNGIVSRIEHQPYCHSSRELLAVQIDAAVNPGNSGGPAVSGGRIVGVAMQGRDDLQNTGYIVPAPVVAHFLQDIEDGSYDGFPDAGVELQAMENPDMRRRFGLTDRRSGVLVTRAIPGSPADGIIQPGDVLLSIDGHGIALDGTVEFRKNERTSAAFLVQQHQMGEEAVFRVLRDGREKSLPVELFRPPHSLSLVIREEYDIQPTYFVYGGLVFIPLTKHYLKTWGEDWCHQAPPRLAAKLGETPQTAGQQVVILSEVLAHDVNKGYQAMIDRIITHVNDQAVIHIRDLVRKTEKAADAGFVEYQTAKGERIVLDPSGVDKAREAIRTIYCLPAERSPDLRRQTEPPRRNSR